MLHHIKTFFFQHMFCNSWLNYFGKTKTQGDTYLSACERLQLQGTNVALTHVSDPTSLSVHHPWYTYYLLLENVLLSELTNITGFLRSELDVGAH